jgi:hypothetical protein
MFHGNRSVPSLNHLAKAGDDGVARQNETLKVSEADRENW